MYRRRKLKKKTSRRLFSRTAGRSNRRNKTSRVRRGGIRF